MTPSSEREDRPGRAPGRYLPPDISPKWESVFAAVPRALFLPDLFWAHDMATGRSVSLDRRTNPDGWLAAADGNQPLVTQWDDGEHTGAAPGQVPTSSASMPSVVGQMIHALQAVPGNRVLNLGVGTGWDTGLLCHRLGDGAVTALDVDAQVTAQARTRLAAAGYHPEVVVGDGLGGWPAGVPYDRVMASFGVRELPWAWVEQTRPGGVILAPFGTHYSNADALVRLTVNEAGTAASGMFLDGVEFMKARTQRLVWPASPSGGDLAESTTTLTVPDSQRFDPYVFAIGLALPGVTHAVQREGDARTLWLYSLTTPAWASVRFGDGQTVHQVRQVGDRRLWEEYETAHRWWEQSRKPGYTRLGMTVDRTGHTFWLDRPENPVPGRASA